MGSGERELTTSEYLLNTSLSSVAQRVSDKKDRRN
nr:MAG TPA: hypothetical protein [Caudoviricetes sp.]